MNYIYSIGFLTLGIVIGIGITWYKTQRVIAEIEEELGKVRKEYYTLIPNKASIMYKDK